MDLLSAGVAAPVSLPRFVEGVRAIAPLGGRAQRVDRLPDGRTALIFRVREAGRRGDLTIVGPRTRALLKETSGFVEAVIVDFKPGWSRPLLGGPASELTDDFVSLEDLWGRAAAELCHELLAVRSLPARLDRLAHAFARQLSPAFEPASARLARHAARMLEQADARVDDLAARLGVTTRHLHRAFVDNVGVGPKEFARALRLQRALRLAETSSEWGRVALEAGYYDQSHLIAEFRDLVGLTPGAFVKRASALDLREGAARGPGL